ncbi:hypothetical protein ACOMHN_044835 [Nucella lapillus]
MPPRRSARGQKKKEAEGASSGPDVQTDGQDILSTSEKLDEVDGPLLPSKIPTQLTKKKDSKKTAVTRKQKILNSGKDTNEEKGNEQDDIVCVVEKNSVRKRLPRNERVHISEEQKNSKQKQTVSLTAKIHVGKMDTCQDGDMLGRHNSKSKKKEMDKKETAKPRGKASSCTISRARKTSSGSHLISATPATGRGVVAKSVTMRANRLTNSSSITTEVSTSSDSDFEEVSSQYRTLESSMLSSTYSDSALSRRLEDSFSDYTFTSSQDFSYSIASSDATDFSSPSHSIAKKERKISGVKADSDTLTNKRNSTTGRSAQKATTATKTTDKAVSRKGQHLVQDTSEPKRQSRKAKTPVSRKKQGKNKAEKTSTAAETDENNIMAILMKMEGQGAPKTDQGIAAGKPSTSGQSWGKKVASKKMAAPKKRADVESSEESDWEEVEDYKLTPVKSQIPDAPVEITIDDPTMLHRKKKKKEFDWKAYVQRKIKRMAREIQVEMHKVHLLCLVSHGMQQSAACSDVTVCATALSLVPPSQLRKDVAFYDDHTLAFFLKWFRSAFCLSAGSAETSRSLVRGSQLLKVLGDSVAGEPRLLVMALAAILRAMGFNVRLVMSLQPLPMKTSSVALGKAAAKRKMDDNCEATATASKKPRKDSEIQKSTKPQNDKHKPAKNKKNPEKAKTIQHPNADSKPPSSTSKKNQPAKSVPDSKPPSSTSKKSQPAKSVPDSKPPSSTSKKNQSAKSVPDSKPPSSTSKKNQSAKSVPDSKPPSSTSKKNQPAKSVPDSKPPSSTSKKNQPAKSVSKPVRKRRQAANLKKYKDSSSNEDSDNDDDDDDGDDDDDDGPPIAKKRASERSSKRAKPSASSKKDDDDIWDDGDESRSGVSDGSNFSEGEELVRKKGRAHGKKIRKGAKKSASRARDTMDMDEESDAEFDESFQTKSLLVKDGKSKKKTNRKVLSEDSGSEELIASKGRDYWLEVYLPRQSKWFCVDCIRCVVGKPYVTSASASKPLLYVLGFENDGSVKDITAKYAPRWLSHTRKQRVDSDWWRESLEPYSSTNAALDDLENRDIKDHLVQCPLPTSIGDFKNHPLYALCRHLLKYQAIYPENSIPVGYIRREPVYARECVHTLHSRDNWLREARLVRLGETAYKMVKSRKRWNRARDQPEVVDLELFGRWQTEDFIPPPAFNGKVPKNDYGNVELFQPSMLPGGTVHVRVPALNRVARKLGIDIAAAMTGWDHHCGYSHPVLDGWVVCEEHKEVLLAAWVEDQEIQRQREEGRREKRVLNNWTALVRGLLIKEKLKKKFNLEDKKVEPQAKKRAKAKKGEKATDVQHAWPARQLHQKEPKQEPTPSHYTVETM